MIYKLPLIKKEFIKNKELVSVLEKALASYKNATELSPEEEANCEKIYSLCEKHFPESVGIKPKPKPEPAFQINQEDFLAELKNNKANRKK